MKRKSHDSLKKDQHEQFKKTIFEKAERKLHERGKKSASPWFGLGMFGIVGWSVALPAVAGTLIGIWIDSVTETKFSWTLMLLALGIIIGSANAWHWVQRERKNIIEERRK